MKLVILTVLWLPISISLLVFSFFNLASYQEKFLDVKGISTISTSDAIGTVANSNQPSSLNFSPSQDIRITVLKRFFSDYKSPLADYTAELVRQSDIWGLDYKLLPAMAMQESGGCKVIPINSYNCWGFGIYGSKMVKFSSYQDAIARVAKTIKKSYIKKGLSNATLVEDRWTPSSRGQWSYGVNYFIGKIKEYEQSLPAS